MSEPTTAYLDEAGRPRLRTSIVAFLDILGFSQASTSCATTEDAQCLLDKIAAAIDDSRDFVRRSFAESERAQANRWATKFFSDNLALGYALDDTTIEDASAVWFIIRCAQKYQLRMVMNGFFVRGALTQGPICLTDEIIFGAALIGVLSTGVEGIHRVTSRSGGTAARSSHEIASCGRWPIRARRLSRDLPRRGWMVVC
jgi:hypothetical protein